MFGQGKDLAAASEKFAMALASTAELISAAEAVYTGTEGEVALLEGQIAKLEDSDPNPGETEIVIATRQGAVLALTESEAGGERSSPSSVACRHVGLTQLAMPTSRATRHRKVVDLPEGNLESRVVAAHVRFVGHVTPAFTGTTR